MGKFKVTTTAQVERDYVVEAPDEATARKRLRIFLGDPDLLREGLVEPPIPAAGIDLRNSTPEKINAVTAFSTVKSATGAREPQGDDKK